MVRYRLHDQNHTQLRDTLRVVGPIVVGVGLIFAAIGFGSFFNSFGTFSPPRYFWCAFVGLPLIGVGGMICQFAFLGKIARYTASEVAPVGRDVTNYMVHGTKDAMREMAGAIGEGLRGETAPVVCGACRAENDAGSNFCKGCGAAIAARQCLACFKSNDADAKFCSECGKDLTAG